MKQRLLAIVVSGIVLLGACADAPEPGDLATFCNLLGDGVGLSDTAAEGEFAQLALVAPPQIRETIDALQTQARDFDELLTLDPPDLGALFTARFDPTAQQDRAALDRYAQEGCNLTVDRPPSTRWNNFVREGFADAAWRDAASTSFEVAGDRIVAATVVFDEAPEQTTQVEEICDAVSDFLISDGADTASVRVLIGTVVWLEFPTPVDECQLP